MRTAFVENLVSRARAGDDLMLIVGDLGYGVVENFAESFPDKFLNAGVAEQNMTGMAAGISSEGLRVFTYSIANFPTMRALEQIRNDICYHMFPVTVVSIGSGVDYGTLGYSHFAVEDISVMRSLPGMVIFSPADELELALSMASIFASEGPSYLRLAKDSQPNLPVVGHWDSTLHPRKVTSGGSKLLILSSGSVASAVLEACESLEGEFPVGFEFYSVPQISPIGLEGIEWGNFEKVLSVEEHVLPGGFGSSILEYLSEHNISLPVKRIGIKHPELLPVGSPDYIRKYAGVDATGVAEHIRALHI